MKKLFKKIHRLLDHLCQIITPDDEYAKKIAQNYMIRWGLK